MGEKGKGGEGGREVERERARRALDPPPPPPLLALHSLSLSLFSYFFYKNAVYTLTQFWFNMWTGFSAQRLYDDWHQVRERERRCEGREGRRREASTH